MRSDFRFPIADFRWPGGARVACFTGLAGIALAIAGCYGGHTHSYSSRPWDSIRVKPDAPFDESRFTLRWRHFWEPVQFFVYASCQGQGEALTLVLPYGPLGETLEIDGKIVEARFEHGAVFAGCEETHAVKGSITVLSLDVGGIRATLSVTAACPIHGTFDFQGERLFARER